MSWDQLQAIWSFTPSRPSADWPRWLPVHCTSLVNAARSYNSIYSKNKFCDTRF